MHDRNPLHIRLFRHIVLCILLFATHELCKHWTQHYNTETVRLRSCLKSLSYAKKNRQHSTFAETISAASDYVCVHLRSCHHASNVHDFCIECSREKNLYEFLEYVFERFDGFVRFDSITLEKSGDLYRCSCRCSVLPWDDAVLMEEMCCNDVNSSQKPIVLRWQAVDPWRECFWQNNAVSTHSVKGVVDGCGAVIDDCWYNVGDFVHGYLLKSASGDAIVLRKYHHDLCCTGVFEL